MNKRLTINNIEIERFKFFKFSICVVEILYNSSFRLLVRTTTFYILSYNIGMLK